MECEVVAIPAATFTMGSDRAEIDRTIAEWQERLLDERYAKKFHYWLSKEYPAHRVSVDAFEIMRTPVTNGSYRRFMATGFAAAPESIARELPDEHPVWGVTIEDARTYAAWLSEHSGLAWRLPSEAQWEWAASGPQGLRYPFGDQFRADACNTIESGNGGTIPVGVLRAGASPFGVLDLGGNVEEWTEGGYAPYPGGGIVEDDLFTISGPGYPVLRGGSFSLGGDLARCRRRHGAFRGTAFEVTGFRLVRTQL